MVVASGLGQEARCACVRHETPSMGFLPGRFMGRERRVTVAPSCCILKVSVKHQKDGRERASAEQSTTLEEWNEAFGRPLPQRAVLAWVLDYGRAPAA